MDKLAFKKLKYKLLSGGVAYKHVKRLIKEIQDHHTDLLESELSLGKSQAEAQQNADQKLGQYDFLADEMIAKKELHSWGNRYPKSIMLALPVGSYIVLFVALLFFFVGIANFVFPVSDSATSEPVGVLGYMLSAYNYFFIKLIVEIFRISLMFIVGPILAVLTLIYALRSQLPLLLAIAGVLILCVLSCATSITAVFPDPLVGIERGSLGVSLGYGMFDFNGWVDSKLRLLFSLTFVSLTAWIYRHTFLVEEM